MTERHEQQQDLCAGSVLGALSSEEEEELERLLSRDRGDLRSVLAGFSQSAVFLAASAPPVAPRPELRSRILDAVKEAGPSAEVIPLRPSVFRVPLVLGWAVAAALALAAGLGWFTLTDLRDRFDDLQDRFGEQQSELARLQEDLEQEQRWSHLLSAPGVQLVALVPTPDGQEKLEAHALYDPNAQTVAFLFRHFPQISEKDYELWVIGEAGPRSLGLIHADEHGRASVRRELLGAVQQVNAFAVSLEPKGGAAVPTQPSGPVLLVGQRDL